MTRSAGASQHVLGLVLLAAVLAIGVGIRIPALDVPGHLGDVLVVSRWAERMASVGPLAFYQDSGSIYPALLYLYWPLGAAFNGDALDIAIKALSIPFDVLIGVLLYAVVARRAGPLPGAGAAALYVLNPGVILA
ncbi:MAG TPA: hypothetical protein VK838_03750, partial [Candidatus Limnocylindrales bacterium]|nr:hypothetical protein [Candidatus Limnocylindrales bacterium]